VNTVGEGKSQVLKQIWDVSTPKRFILEALREAGVIECDSNKGDPCLMQFRGIERCRKVPIAEELL